VADEFVQGRELRAGLIEGREKAFSDRWSREWSFPRVREGFESKVGQRTITFVCFARPN